tara:strand:+ start:649 stop:1506 length:858 start_codon:yes stop_codon:yes gene_type:complete
LDRECVLITGASTGIGLALTKYFLEAGYTVFATARKSSLSRFATEIDAHRNLIIRPLDVANADQRHGLIKEIESNYGGIDILINNAGISYRAVVEDMTVEDEKSQLETNYIAPMELARLVLPSMRMKRRGMIINISSVSGMMAMPTMSSYSASKFALEGAMEALWYEARPWGIIVKLVQPGFVNSDSYNNVLLTKKAILSKRSGPYYPYYKSMEPFVEQIMNLALATPSSVAKKVLKIVRKRTWKPRHSVTIDARIFYVLRRILPRFIYHFLLYHLLPDRKTWGR